MKIKSVVSLLALSFLYMSCSAEEKAGNFSNNQNQITTPLYYGTWEMQSVQCNDGANPVSYVKSYALTLDKTKSSIKISYSDEGNPAVDEPITIIPVTLTEDPSGKFRIVSETDRKKIKCDFFDRSSGKWDECKNKFPNMDYMQFDTLVEVTKKDDDGSLQLNIEKDFMCERKTPTVIHTKSKTKLIPSNLSF